METQPVVTKPVVQPNPPARPAPLPKSTAPVLCATCGKLETEAAHDLSKPGSHHFAKPESAFRHLYRVVFRRGDSDESAYVVASNAAEAVNHLGVADGQGVGVSTVASRVEVATVDDARARVAPVLPTVSKKPYGGVEQLATTAILNAKASDALTQFELDGLNLYLKDSCEKKLWMNQQALQDVVGPDGSPKLDANGKPYSAYLGVERRGVPRV